MISIVIPTINEEKNISLILSKLIEYLPQNNITFEVIVVDDSSKDNTVEEAKKFENSCDIKIINNTELRGLGYALKLGWDSAKYEYVMFAEADSPLSIDDLLKLILNKEPNTMLIGSRYIKGGGYITNSKTKKFLSKILNNFVTKYLSLDIIDATHSHRIFPSSLKVNISNFIHPLFLWELTYKAKKNGLLLKEIPVTFVNNRKYGASKNTLIKMAINTTRNIISLIFIRLK